MALVSAEDYPILNQWNWCINGKYAARRDKGKLILMHRFIINAPAGMQVDHINGNKLDNRRENLRLATANQNQQNAMWSNNKTGYKGVYYVNKKCRKHYRVQITVDGKSISLGLHLTAEDAAQVYNEAARKYFGEFAKLNEVNI